MELSNNLKGTITRVRVSNKENKTPLCIFNIEGTEQPVFLTQSQVQSATGFASNFQSLVGEALTVEFYAKDAKLPLTDAPCTKDGTIVKEFTFEMSETTSKISKAAALGMGINV